jgi:hypothetical protein
VSEIVTILVCARFADFLNTLKQRKSYDIYP